MGVVDVGYKVKGYVFGVIVFECFSNYYWVVVI